MAHRLSLNLIDWFTVHRLLKGGKTWFAVRASSTRTWISQLLGGTKSGHHQNKLYINDLFFVYEKTFRKEITTIPDRNVNISVYLHPPVEISSRLQPSIRALQPYRKADCKEKERPLEGHPIVTIIGMEASPQLSISYKPTARITYALNFWRQTKYKKSPLGTLNRTLVFLMRCLNSSLKGSLANKKWNKNLENNRSGQPSIRQQDHLFVCWCSETYSISSYLLSQLVVQVVLATLRS